MRLLAIIPISGEASKVKHYVGLPPELARDKDTRQALGSARFLVIEQNADGVFLYRYGVQGEYVGDTWHMNVDDAKHQASYEYGDVVREWVDIPSSVENVVAFGVNYVASAS